MLTAAAINGFREHVKRTLAYAKYKVGGTYYRADISRVYVRSDGKVAIEFSVDHTLPGTITVTEVQLYNNDNVLWLTVSENITRKARQEAIFYRFTIEIKET